MSFSEYFFNSNRDRAVRQCSSGGDKNKNKFLEYYKKKVRGERWEIAQAGMPIKLDRACLDRSKILYFTSRLL